MTTLTCRTLLSSLNAEPYKFSSMPEEMTEFGEDDLPEAIPHVSLDYEVDPDEWQPKQSLLSGGRDPRLPRTFVDGAVNTIEIAGSIQDSMGYARSIRAGQLGVGAIKLDSPTQPILQATYILAVTTIGYTASQIQSLHNDLKRQSRPFELIAWQAASDTYFKSPEEQEVVIRDVAAVRRRLRRHVTDEMLRREQALVQQLNEPVYVDGRYVDRQPATNNQLVVGVIKSMRRRYLDLPRQQLLYKLRVGERTPAFATESQRIPVISFYGRIASEGGATTGLVRVELGRTHFETVQGKDFSLLDAILGQMVQLHTHDAAYARTASTIEPIQVIEQRIQRLFHPPERVAMYALNILR